MENDSILTENLMILFRGLSALLWMMAEIDQIDLEDMAPIYFGLAVGAEGMIRVDDSILLGEFIDEFGEDL